MMRGKKLIKPKALLAAMLGATSIAAHGTDAESAQRADILVQVQKLYGLDEENAIRRLSAEGEANDLFQQLDVNEIRGYAGAWFDADSLTLTIAASTTEGLTTAEQLGAKTVLVPYSLAQLQETFDAATSLELPEGVFQSAYIDTRSNLVVLEVAPGHGDSVKAKLRSHLDRLTVEEAIAGVDFSTDVRGGDATWNHVWTPGTPRPCSVGATHETGYYTAGHCGLGGHEFRTAGGTLLGKMTERHLYYPGNSRDIATIQKAAGVFPKPHINGYTDGIFSVPAKWAGVSKSAVGTTVCRYGQTSGGPHCGTVHSFNFAVGGLTGVTRVTGSCTNDGDSGGPFVSASALQIQGTVIGAGSAPSGATNTCPTPTSTYLLFQPIEYHIGQYSKSVLTAHGAAAPSATGVQCPVASMSGLGTWYCKFASWNSQGVASFNWSLGTPSPAAGGGYQVTGNCSGGTVNISLTLNNDYGSTVIPRSFPCPLGPVP